MSGVEELRSNTVGTCLVLDRCKVCLGQKKVAKARVGWPIDRCHRGIVLFFALVTFVAGYMLRPDTVTSDRVGYSMVDWANSCKTLSDVADLSAQGNFHGAVFGFIRVVLPLAPSTVEEWDLFLAMVGSVVLLFVALWVSRCPWLRVHDALLFAAMSALSSMYVFMICKDIIQLFVALAVFLLATRMRDVRVSMVIIVALLTWEAATWRTYYYIVAAFVPVAYYLIIWLRDRESGWRRGLTFVLVLLVTALAFAFLLKLVSPSDYSKIVMQHGADREEITMGAASGISSLITVTDFSPVPIFVLNWFINALRILFPVELFMKSPYYWAFAVYQLLISVSVIGSMARGLPDCRARLCVSVYIAFVLASATFEPDFGSWVRHETAWLPIVIASVLGYAGKCPGRRCKSIKLICGKETALDS